METTEVSNKKEPLPIGGLLFLVAIGVVFAPLRVLHLIVTTYPTIFSDGTWEALTSQNSEFYSPFWGPVLIGELTVNVVFLVVGVYMAYLFFTKKAVFPKWYFGLALFSSAFIILDAYLVSLIMPEIEMFDSDTQKEFFRSLFSLLVWSPYLLFSQRAKDTFVVRNDQYLSTQDGEVIVD